MPDGKICSKCNVNPASKSDVWCKECRAEYQRTYSKDREERIADEYFVKGARAMQLAIARPLARGNAAFAMIQAGETANWVMGLDLPKREVSIEIKEPA